MPDVSGFGGLGKTREGLTNCQLQNSRGDVKYRTENVVDSIVITIYGARWVLDFWWWGGNHFIRYINI